MLHHDTADSDGLAEAAAQAASERPIGDLNADELRKKFRELLHLTLAQLAHAQYLVRKGMNERAAEVIECEREKLDRAWREVVK